MEKNRMRDRQTAFFRQLVFLVVIIAIAMVIFKQLNFFIGSFLGAITIYVVLRKTLFRLVEKNHWRPWMASLTLVLLMSVLLLALGYLVFKVVASEIPNIDTSQIVVSLKELPDKVNELLGFTVFTGDVLTHITGFLTKFASGIINSTYSFAVNVFLMLVILYFMLAHGRSMEKKIFDYIPFWGKSLGLIKHEVKNMIYSNAVGIPLIMFGQGLAATALYWALGMNNVVFWGFVTALAGLIPMIGTVLVSVPLGLWLISNGEVWQGIVLMGCGLFIVANVDNLIRIVMMKQVANTPPLIVIFGVILGIPVFGFWGIIFGPLLISGFLLLIKIYYVEYDLIDPEEAKSKPGTHYHPGQKAVHKALTVVRGRVKTSARPTPAPCNPDVPTEVCESLFEGEDPVESKPEKPRKRGGKKVVKK